MNSVNKDKVSNIFQHLFIPLDRLLGYGKFINKYINLLPKKGI